VRTAFYPGTFDPITNGHLDIVTRALGVFARVIIAVGTAREKDPMFGVDERVEMIRETVADMEGVEVTSFDGLLADGARKAGASAILRGLRALSDFDYEFQMAWMNRRLAPDIETVFLMPNERYTYLNSTVVKEVASLGGEISELVPEPVLRRLRERRR